MMHQEVEYVPTPLKVNVDGIVDAKGVRYIGTAVRRPNGKYTAMADVGGAFCLVEAIITFEPSPKTSKLP